MTNHLPHLLPERIEDITPTWLTQALESSFPDVEIASLTILDRHSGTTGRARLGLEYASGSSGPATVFVKLPPFADEQRKLVAATDMGRREARFYASLADETPIRVPHCYSAGYGEAPTQYIMVLEDLEATGCSFPSNVDTYSRDYGRRVIEALADLHAHFWADARFDAGLSWVPPAGRGGAGAKFIRMAREQFGRDFPPVFTELCQLYEKHHGAICDLWDEGPSTLVHGDIHAGNQFLDGERVGFFDWAVISRSPGVRDLGIFLCNSCSPEVRRAEGVGWVRAYHQRLARAGVDAPDFDTLWLRFRRAVLYGWIAATATAAVGDRWQPLAVSIPAMRRSTEACIDLGTLEALREAI